MSVYQPKVNASTAPPSASTSPSLYVPSNMG